MVTTIRLVAAIPAGCQQTCENEKDNTFKGQCPKAASCSWMCSVERFKRTKGTCEGDRVYHCARNYTDKNLLDPKLPRGFKYIEACARNVVCSAGNVKYLF